MNKAPSIPELRIIATEDVLPHEEHDAQRAAPLFTRIRKADTWLNPPIVAPIPDDHRFVILDGANRHYCLQELGIPHILVQVVEYGTQEVQLETWNHVLSHTEMKVFLQKVHNLDGVLDEPADRTTAEAALEVETTLAYLRLLDEDRVLVLSGEQYDIGHKTRQLRALVDIYKDISKIDRFNGDNPATVRRLYPHADVIVVFPQYMPEDIIRAAKEDMHLPPGISRHLVHGRALRLHYPLDALRDATQSIEEKNRQLELWMQDKVAHKQLRLYQEATYIFDE